NRSGVAGQPFSGGGAGTCNNATQQHRGLKQGTSLHAVHLLQRILTQHLPHAIAVDGLSAHHSTTSHGTRQELDCLHHQGWSDRHVRQRLEGERLQGIARQHGGGFVELHMYCGPPASKGIVVHTRQIVVYQRIRMDQLNRRCSVVERDLLGSRRDG